MAQAPRNPKAAGRKSQQQELREICFSGHVQGVGFRYSTQLIASGLDVTGYVMNLPDGRVKLVAEGSAKELDLLERQIAKRMAGNISDATCDTRPATGQFEGFKIRY